MYKKLSGVLKNKTFRNMQLKDDYQLFWENVIPDDSITDYFAVHPAVFYSWHKNCMNMYCISW